MNEAMRLSASATAAWRNGDAVGAERLARQALAAEPRDPNALQILAAACLGDGRNSEAADHLRAADQLAPSQPNILNMLGVALRRTGDDLAARAAFVRAGERGSADAWRNLGALERSANAIDAAIAAYEKALALQPNHAAAHADLAYLLESRHELDRAETHATKALSFDPASAVARLALAQVKLRQKLFVEAEPLLAPVVQTSGSVVNRALAWGLIGEARDRTGDAKGAFEAFTASNRLLRELHPGDLDAVDAPFHPVTVRRLTRFIAAEDVSAWRWPAQFERPAPVFLVGFPRSGTTLLDQILASHPGILSLEEKDLLAPTCADLLSENALQRWAAMSAEEVNARRRVYWARAEEAVGAQLDGRIVIDKLPLNLVLAPVIARIFPDAKVILALRDPRDCVLSSYQQRFGMNPAMAQMLDLTDAARYYDAAMTAWTTCQARAPLAAHEARYESVVANVETAARDLAAFLAVPFDPAMLDFTTTARRRDIMTPSARQVTEPLYQRSVARWRAYAEPMALVVPVLAPWVERFGYDP